MGEAEGGEEELACHGVGDVGVLRGERVVSSHGLCLGCVWLCITGVTGMVGTVARCLLRVALAVTSPFDQTVILSLSEAPSEEGLRALGDIAELRDFLFQASSFLKDCLDAGALRAGLLQSSGYCGGLLFDSDEFAQRCLLSCEELSASMAQKLLEEAPDE